MRLKFWHNRWESDDIGFHQAQGNIRLQQFWDRLALSPEDTVFVPLCGKSMDMVWLAGQGHSVLGIEASSLAVEAFFQENGLNPQVRQEGQFQRWESSMITLLCGDYFQLLPSHLAGVTAVYDRAALIALPPPMRQDYVRHLIQILPATAKILLEALEYAEEAMEGPPFSVPESEICERYSGAYKVDLLSTQEVLEDHLPFQQRGLDWLQAKVYQLTPKTAYR